VRASERNGVRERIQSRIGRFSGYDIFETQAAENEDTGGETGQKSSACDRLCPRKFRRNGNLIMQMLSRTESSHKPMKCSASVRTSSTCVAAVRFIRFNRFWFGFRKCDFSGGKRAKVRFSRFSSVFIAEVETERETGACHGRV
jgi:hypothetical protein